PLTVAALGADPPGKSVHFHLSLLSLIDGVARPAEPTEEEVRHILSASERLNTKRLTVVPGAGCDHGLVWENGSLDLGTTPAEEVCGHPVRSHLPQGDGERILRRFIDDSVNLLSELELNRRRSGEGEPEVNLLWPWGHGFREPVANLTLRRGEVGWVLSDSLRMQGLARLAGYRHGNRLELREGAALKEAGAFLRRHSTSILSISGMAELRKSGDLERIEHETRELDRGVFSRLDLDEESAIVLVSNGLALVFDSKTPRDNTVPFDERALEESALGTAEAWRLVDSVLSPEGKPGTIRSNA
ncbi:MAG TPA: hypothetical protein VEX38_05125, partial [Fimbriimonadaceae bacterium]|nr:hypothetical protein [Fimbriimonadaceae bacterium]